MQKKILYICVSALCLGLPAFGAVKRVAKKVVPDKGELLEKARAAYRAYDLDLTDEILGEIDGYEPAQTLEQQATTMRNMLDRVDNIVIVDSLTVDSAAFFTHYRLSDEAGTLRANAEGMPMYAPANGREIYDTAEGRITLTGILDDGTPEQVRTISIGEGDESLPPMAYPFMQADGTTLYLAMLNGSDGLGGWDIYMTRRDENGNFYEPTNLGMPYNSPANDYLLAIDEGTGLGWWATDRNAEPGQVTIYIFKPNATRSNLDSDADNIVSRAKIESIADSWPEGFDKAKTLDVLNQRAHGGESAETADFELSLGDGRVYTSLSQFKNRQAADEMAHYLTEAQKVNATEAVLYTLRNRYSEGDLSVANQIKDLERALDKQRDNLLKLRNNVIKLEN